MHAIRHHVFGPPHVLVLDELPDLTAAAGEVRVAVEACGVHFVDTHLRHGREGPIPLPDLPTVPGREVAGVVDQVGRGVDDAWLGRRVVAHLGPVPGGYAEQAVTRVEHLLAVPDPVAPAEAVTMVGTGRTTQAILELEPPRADDVVLVLAAAGGIGWLLVQAAHATHARVVAAVGGEAKRDLMAQIAPSQRLDYEVTGWSEGLAPTLVYDGVGGHVGRAAFEALAPGGRLAMYGHASGKPTRFTSEEVVAKGLRVQWLLGPRMAALPGGFHGLAGRALDGLMAGTWSPRVTLYPLAGAARAHADLEERRTTGKVVLVTDQASETRSA